MTEKPDPPPQVEVGRDRSAEVAASTLSQFAALQKEGIPLLRSQQKDVDPLVRLTRRRMKIAGFEPSRPEKRRAWPSSGRRESPRWRSARRRRPKGTTIAGRYAL